MIRRATLNDIETLAKLFDAYRVFYKKPSDKEGAVQFLKERIEKADSEIFVACNEADEIVGFVQLYPLFSSTQMKRLWLLNDLFVDARFRRQGYSKALIKAAKDLCKVSKASGMYLETEKGNVEGNALYQNRVYFR